jgi:uncharacterized glyoxalase superfamily protein PhnB
MVIFDENQYMITRIVSKLPFIDKEATIEYFCQKLGFDLTADYGDYLIMETGDVEVHFFHFPQLNPAKSDFMIYLRIDEDIDAYYHQLIEKGAEIHPNAPIADKAWGQREFALLDPAGTLLTFGQALH